MIAMIQYVDISEKDVQKAIVLEHSITLVLHVKMIPLFIMSLEHAIKTMKCCLVQLQPSQQNVQKRKILYVLILLKIALIVAVRQLSRAFVCSVKMLRVVLQDLELVHLAIIYFLILIIDLRIVMMRGLIQFVDTLEMVVLKDFVLERMIMLV